MCVCKHVLVCMYCVLAGYWKCAKAHRVQRYGQCKKVGEVYMYLYVRCTSMCMYEIVLIRVFMYVWKDGEV